MKYDEKTESTAQYLTRIYEEERRYDGKIRGYELDYYKAITDKIDGIKSGLICVPAKPNVGKSAFITSMAIDLMRKNPYVRVVFYTLDDTKDEIRKMMVSFVSQVSRNKVDRNLTYDSKSEQSVKDAYDYLVQRAKDDFFVLKEFEEIQTIENLESDMIGYASSKATVFFIDSPSKIKTGHSDRKHGDTVADFLLHISNKLKVPVITSNEIPKSAPRRPSGGDIKESANYSYNAKVIICLSTVDERCFEAGASPIIMFDFQKNKFSGYKGRLFSIFKTSICDFNFKDWTKEERDGIYNLMYESDKQYEKMHS